MEKESPKHYEEYFSSFSNAFELKRGESPTSMVQKELSDDEYVYQYLNHSDNLIKPHLKKANSWSSIDPTRIFERDQYLSPYICTNYPRSRSQTLPIVSKHSALKTNQQYSASNLHLEAFSDEMMTSSKNSYRTPIGVGTSTRRDRSSTDPPSISLTTELGHSTELLHSPK